MLHAVWLALALWAQSPQQDLLALEAHIATLKGQRASLRTYGDNAAREELDRKVKLLEGALDQAHAIIQRQQDHCVRTVPPQVVRPGQQLNNPCAVVGQGVVGSVVRLLEIREKLKTARTWADGARRDGLQAEAKALEQSLGLR